MSMERKVMMCGTKELTGGSRRPLCRLFAALVENRIVIAGGFCTCFSRLVGYRYTLYTCHLQVRQMQP